jgi:hypothetical protein
MTQQWLKKKQWVAYRREMLESPAFRYMPPLARRVLHALEIEHMRHGGKENGNLVSTYDTIRKYCDGASKRLVAQALRQLEALGFLAIKRGKVSGNKREPSLYLLTYLPGHNSGPPSDDWSEIKTYDEAARVLGSLRQKKPPSPRFKAFIACPDGGF